MPIGTGNDLSQSLKYGSKMNLLRLDGYIRTIFKEDLPVKKFDIWEVDVKNTLKPGIVPKKRLKNYKPKNFTRGMVIYMGFGYDAYTIYCLLYTSPSPRD